MQSSAFMTRKEIIGFVILAALILIILPAFPTSWTGTS